MKSFTTLVFIALICLAIHIPSAFAYDVIFNAKTLIYHAPTCEWAQKCTKSCIKIDHTLAQGRGGVPCKVCGGLGKSGKYKNRNDDARKKELAEGGTYSFEMARELERMRAISPTFDSDYQSLHGEK